MAYDPTNVPNWLDIEAEFDLSGDHDFAVATSIKAGLVQLSRSGGGFQTGSVGTADGSTFVGAGNKQPETFTVRAVYTDGETTDDWETLKTAEGQKVAFRYQPKGAGVGNRFHVVKGILTQVTSPTPDGVGPFVYDAMVYGMESFEPEQA